jgi:hypothetical protein
MANYNLGRNCSVSVNGSKMTVTIDLAADGSPSSTGKTTVIASSGGAQPIGVTSDGTPCKLNLSVFCPISN